MKGRRARPVPSIGSIGGRKLIIPLSFPSFHPSIPAGERRQGCLQNTIWGNSGIQVIKALSSFQQT